MPVPTLITSLSQTAASNSPPSTESPTTADDYLRQYAAFIAALRDGAGFTNPLLIASAATTDIGAANSMFVEITGVTAITSFGITYRGPRFLRFTGAMLLTHNATTLNLIGAANITTVAGDTALAIPNQALTGWNIVQYTRSAGLPAVAGANSDITSLTGPVSTVNAAPILHLNDIINGDFKIAQVRTSFAAPASSAYDLDGWINANTSTAVFTIAQVAGSTSGRLARQVTITTADAAVAAGDFVCDLTRIEGSNIEKYVGQTFTVGFRARVPVAGIHCVTLRNGVGDRSYVAEINFPTANVYQNCTFTVVGGLPTAGTWNYTAGIGLEITFAHMCGTTFQTTAGAWQTGNFLGTSNQVNDCATNGNLWAMEKVTLNLGTVAAASEIDYGSELQRCLRQNMRWEGNSSGVGFVGIGTGYVVSATTANIFIPTAPMRATPSLSFGGTLSVADGAASPAVTAISAAYSASSSGFWVALTAAGGGLTLGNGAFLYTQNAATNFLNASARL